jgi:hypothetical protein
MLTQTKNEQHADREKHERQQLRALIGEQVMRTLGRPDGLHRVQVRQLWANRYRVNVLVGGDAASAKVAQSYFLVADDQGNVVASTPPITKQY